MYGCFVILYKLYALFGVFGWFKFFSFTQAQIEICW